MYFLSVDEVIVIHQLVIARAGGVDGIRDRNLLESAVYHPQSQMFEQYLYADVYKMAAAYCYHIIKNHAFIDGNKRTGILVAMTFLEKNGFVVSANIDSLYRLAIDTAQSKISKDEIAVFFEMCCVKNSLISAQMSKRRL